jgi:hypothetical protein
MWQFFCGFVLGSATRIEEYTNYKKYNNHYNLQNCKKLRTKELCDYYVNFTE